MKFLSKQDINKLSCKALFDEFGISQVDMIIILGNSIPFIAELGAKAYKSGLAIIYNDYKRMWYNFLLWKE